MREHAPEMLRVEETPPPPAPDGDAPGRARGARSRFRPRRVETEPDDAGSRDDLVAEVLLLREENARLKAAAHEVPSLGRLLAQARAMPSVQAAHEDLGDEAAQMLLEGLVLRDSILAVCHELERSLAVVKVRLAEVGDPTAPEGAGVLRPVGPQDSGHEPGPEEVSADGAGEA
jgi:hypothetical protein